MLSSEYARELAMSFGKLIEWDCVGEGPQTDLDFLRFRVEIDITKPLVPGLFITRLDGKEYLVSLKYERLSDFCYRCGCLGHGRDSCTNEVITKYAGKWSSEMRAKTVCRLQTPSHHPQVARFSQNHNPKVTHSHHPLTQTSPPRTNLEPRVTNIPQSPEPEHVTSSCATHMSSYETCLS
ncbi:reverse transcriptase, partial [Tanacetum coccineum]